MPNFDVEAFVTKLDRMGMKLTAVPLADGKLRINRWRMLEACEHSQQIQDLWTTQIGEDQERIDVLAAHLADAAPRAAGYSISPNRMRIDLPLKPAPGADIGSSTAPDSRKTEASQLGATKQKPPGMHTAMSVSPMAAVEPVVPPQRAVDKTADVSDPLRALIGPGAQKLQGLHVAPGRQTAAGAQPASPALAGAQIAAGQPSRPGLRAATDTPRPEGQQAAVDRPPPADRQDVSGPRGAGGSQKVAGTPPPGGLRNAR